MKKFFSALLFCVFLFALSVSSAFALSVNISTSNPALGTVGSYQNAAQLSSGSSFTVTLVASDYEGEVTWRLSEVTDTTEETYDSNSGNSDSNSNYDTPVDTVPVDTAVTEVNNNLSNVTMSTTEGNVTTITGVLNSASYQCSVFVIAEDTASSDSNSTNSHQNAMAAEKVSVANTAYFQFYILNSDKEDYQKSEYGSDSQSAPSYPDDSSSYDDSSSTEVLPNGSIYPIQSTELPEGVLEKIAASEDIDVTEINFLTPDNIDSPYEPTEEMKKQASDEGMQYAAQLNTVTFTEAGYYLFEVDFPEEVIGTSVENLRLQFVDSAKVQGSSVKSAFLELMVDRFLAGNELRDMLGNVVDTVPGKALLLMMANSGGSFTMYALKILLALLGGCNAGVVSYAGLGVAGLLGLSGSLVFRKFFKSGKRDLLDNDKK